MRMIYQIPNDDLRLADAAARAAEAAGFDGVVALGSLLPWSRFAGERA